ncbi:c-type cytochrome [Sulfidibacter corallicola]|uniref:ABC transporter substrate-binding protein n=1 Tax=Sulfidibacter corallicola TaxID=2818388 RepID=A0A8A4TP32_SULCO|nr:ABC transporter substrate-binding protein [Sulfidibacter corallicola]QTD50852.1 ABC transporter substrate-binding protein [Sulfidibacter corallicola]
MSAVARDDRTTAVAATSGLGEAALRGQAIYEKGVSLAGGTITAVFGSPPVAIDAAAMPCVGCHGGDGRGRSEGGVVPSDITWAALTRPYHVTTEKGRRRPPYDEALVKRAVTAGLDSGATPLDPVMPRYGMAERDLADLMAYLREMRTRRDPGVAPDRLVLGVVLGDRSQPPDYLRGVRQIAAAFCADVNGRGGIFGRMLQPEFLALPADRGRWKEVLGAFLVRRRPFALIAGTTAGWKSEIEAVVAETQTPMIAGMRHFQGQAALPERHLFYVLAEPGDLVRGLVARAAESMRAVPTAVLCAEGEMPLGRLAVTACRQAGWEEPPLLVALETEHDGAAAARSLEEKGVGLVFFLGGGDGHPGEAALLGQAVAMSWRPKVYALGSRARPELYRQAGAFADLVLAWPVPPRPQAWERHRDYARLMRERGLPRRLEAAQVMVLASLTLLQHALLDCGRRVSRERLVEALERCYDCEIGYAPPVTYNPNRRVGSRRVFFSRYHPEGGKMTDLGMIALDADGRLEMNTETP